MSTLYVSDLDGTLLRSDESVSEYTVEAVNALVNRGIRFSYATARSLITAKKATKGLEANIPLIVYNGAFVVDNGTEQLLIGNFFDGTVGEVLEDLFASGIYPIVYAYIHGKERFSFVPGLCSEGARRFLDTRKGDRRTRQAQMPEELKAGDIFYITCIDESEKLGPLYEKYRCRYHCVYHTDIYSGEQWLEIMPREASKSNAAKQLQAMLGCDKLIVFGDGKNDIDLFQAADECYAMANAHEDLKKLATGILLSNDEDGVARWLLANA